MNKENLKEKFIAYFGEEKWNEEEMLREIFEFQMFCCEFLKVVPIPVVVEEMEEDSRYYVEENYIALSKKCITDKIEACKCVVHELRHYYQHLVIELKLDEEYRNVWEYEFKKRITAKDLDSDEQLLKYITQSIEMDAFAFQKYMIKEYFDIDTEIYGFEYDMLLQFHIEDTIKK